MSRRAALHINRETSNTSKCLPRYSHRVFTSSSSTSSDSSELLQHPKAHENILYKMEPIGVFNLDLGVFPHCKSVSNTSKNLLFLFPTHNYGSSPVRLFSPWNSLESDWLTPPVHFKVRIAPDNITTEDEP